MPMICERCHQGGPTMQVAVSRARIPSWDEYQRGIPTVAMRWKHLCPSCEYAHTMRNQDRARAREGLKAVEW